jgi:hypothetical protein
LLKLLFVPLLFTVAAAASAQTPDPVTTAVGQEWQASEVGRTHLAEAVQKLVQAYGALQQKQAAVDAYWKNYVAGLSAVTGRDEGVSSR